MKRLRLARILTTLWNFVVRPKRARISLTWEGIAFSAFLAAVGLAAVNTGANLLYMFFSMMAAMMILSALGSYQNLRRLEVTREHPHEVFAGQRFRVTLGLTNRKRRFHSYCIRLLDEEQDGRIAGACYAMRIERGKSTRLQYEGRYERRGIRRLARIALNSRFPFGFLSKTPLILAPAEILVCPRIYPAANFIFQHLAHFGHQPAPKKGEGVSLYSVREYRPDDCARRILWKVSAKSSQIFVRETETEDRQKISLLLDNLCARQPDAAADARFEAAVSCAASVAKELIERGFQIELLTREGRVPFDTAQSHFRRVVRALALIPLRAPSAEMPHLPSAEPDSLSLWFDYGFGAASLSESIALKRLDTAPWPPDEFAAEGDAAFGAATVRLEPLASTEALPEAV